MIIPVLELESEEYYLEYGSWEHACQVIPPQYKSIVCDVCGKTVEDDFDYSDEYRQERSGH